MSDAYRDMWLAEMGAVCREVPREERAVVALEGAVRNALLNAISTDRPQAVQIDAQGVA